MEIHREAEFVRASVAVREVVCEVCSRTFRRESDCKRHKCVAEKGSLLVSSMGRSTVRYAGGGSGARVV